MLKGLKEMMLVIQNKLLFLPAAALAAPILWPASPNRVVVKSYPKHPAELRDAAQTSFLGSGILGRAEYSSF